MFSQIMSHLDKHNILVKFQHGFRFCETQLLNTVEDDDFSVILQTYLSWTLLKHSTLAVPYRRLLHKMEHYRVTGCTNRMIESGLCQRQQRVCQQKQRVVLDGASSHSL